MTIDRDTPTVTGDQEDFVAGNNYEQTLNDFWGLGIRLIGDIARLPERMFVHIYGKSGRTLSGGRSGADALLLDPEPLKAAFEARQLPAGVEQTLLAFDRYMRPDGLLGASAAAVGVVAGAVVAAAGEHLGRVDVLVNVAGGLSVIKPLAETADDEWTREIDRNARTTFLMCRAALPLLRQSRGAIINFASPAGVRAKASLGAYSAAKAAVVALTRALALEEARNGVRVNAIAPGMIDTAQNVESAREPSAVRWVTRQQIADVVLFLAGDTASGISGETIHVLGGAQE